MSETKILSQELAFKGKHVQVRLDRIIDNAGNTSTLEIVVHPGAVCVVPLLDNGDVVLVRQYRHATGTRLLEICAGGLKPGEDPLEAARRELEEETGYLAGKLVERARFWTTPGFTTEFMYLYEATDLVKTQTNLDEDEIIDVEIATPEDSLRMIDDGRIQDAKSILGLLRVLPRR
ncbi:MAG TPA: NUDIX hydrolase [Terriglobia bacterium]|jgi:ADP-ribose pyrophosphatase|nr:NUDIX hydrolase [Terriglobia bacterium]